MKAYYADLIITEQGPIHEAYLLEKNGKIIGIEGKSVAEKRTSFFDYVQVIIYKEQILAPGYIDLHTHGAVGYETGIDDLDGLRIWAESLLAHGVTGFLPTTVSLPLEKLEKAALDLRMAMRDPNTNLLGLHLEGPFLTPGEKSGAQNPAYFCTDFPLAYQRFISENSDLIRYMAVEPLHPKIEEIMAFCGACGIKVSAAHSEILYEDFRAQSSYGYYSGITHTFNGMRGLDHHQPGLAYAACLEDRLYAEIICDGFHVSYPMLRLFFKLKGDERVILITDSMAAAKMGPGAYQLGEIEVTVTPEGKVYKEDGRLAGSTLTMDQAVRNIVTHLQIPVEKVIRMGSLNPARMLGIDQIKGSLAPGKDADFIVLNKDLETQATYIKGKRVFNRDA